jgi:hypothetical protein
LNDWHDHWRRRSWHRATGRRHDFLVDDEIVNIRVNTVAVAETRSVDVALTMAVVLTKTVEVAGTNCVVVVRFDMGVVMLTGTVVTIGVGIVVGMDVVNVVKMLLSVVSVAAVVCGWTVVVSDTRLLIVVVIGTAVVDTMTLVVTLTVMSDRWEDELDLDLRLELLAQDAPKPSAVPTPIQSIKASYFHKISVEEMRKDEKKASRKRWFYRRVTFQSLRFPLPSFIRYFISQRKANSLRK